MALGTRSACHDAVLAAVAADFFNSAVNASLHSILGALAAVYFGSIFFWGTMYYILWR